MLGAMTTVCDIVLVRYGAIPEVARFANPAALMVARGDGVIVETHRGQELGTVLEGLRPSGEPTRGETPAEPSGDILRRATDEDRQQAAEIRFNAAAEFAGWEQRINEWELDLQLVDLEWTLNRSRLILYVLNERGPDCAKLALQAAAGGWGVIDVQPVAAEGLVPRETGHGGCGSCGCHN